MFGGDSGNPMNVTHVLKIKYLYNINTADVLVTFSIIFSIKLTTNYAWIRDS